MQMFVLAADVSKKETNINNCLAKTNVFFGVIKAPEQFLGFSPVLFCVFGLFWEKCFSFECNENHVSV